MCIIEVPDSSWFFVELEEARSRFMTGIEVPDSSWLFVELLSVRCAYVELLRILRRIEL